MNIITADDEEFALRALNRAVKGAVPDAVVHSFKESTELLADIRQNGFCPDVAFLDIELSDINGLELAGDIKTICPKVNIIFVTGFSQYVNSFAGEFMKQYSWAEEITASLIGKFNSIN